VEVLPLGRLIGANIGVGRRQPEIANMPEQVPLRILRAGVAEIGADTPIPGSAVGHRPALDPQAAHQYEAAAVEDFVTQPLEYGAEMRQREIRPGNVADIETAGPHGGDRGLDLGNLCRG
jgi:hypothetical protein